MRIPIWLTLGVAALVLFFGGYRIWFALRGAPQEPDGEPKRRGMLGGGFYRMGQRTHLLVGIVYLLLGGSLVATSFGWNPFGNFFGPNTETPKKDEAPTKAPLPTDRLPRK